MPRASVAGVPILSAGINATSGLLTSRSSSALVFLLASESTSVTAISSPEFHTPFVGAAKASVPNPKPTTIDVAFLL